MADPSLQLLDDNPSNTPLDLLLNAISGSGGYTFEPDGDDGEVGGGDEAVVRGADADASGEETMVELLEGDGANGNEEHAPDTEESRKRPRDDDDTDPHDVRHAKVARTLGAHFGAGAARPSDAFSTIEVWHPKTGQKSYGKERRILQPPPTLRVTGPLLPLLTQVTLSAHPNVDTEASAARPTFSSQSHRFALNAYDDPALGSFGRGTGGKKDEREHRKREIRALASKTGWGGTLPWERNRVALRARDELADGIAFPGLWVGEVEDMGKIKEFRLELSVAQPGVEQSSAEEAAAEAVTQPIDEAALRHVLGSATMEPVMNLNQAEQASAPEHTPLPDLLPSLDPGNGPETETQGDMQVETQVDTQVETQTESQAETQIETQLQTQPATQPAQSETQSQVEAQLQAQPSAPPAWATFVSDPLSIVSKPSQKTAKARSMASCLSTSDAFALFVRVNAQTVRTKFLKLDGADTDTPVLTARAGKWSPFRFEVVARASPPEEDSKGTRTRFKLDSDHEANIVTYGSIVRIVDVQGGVKSDPLRLVRVDKNEVVIGGDAGHPVSELQRVGFVRSRPDLTDDIDDMGRRQYLSSPGALAGAGEVNVSRARPGRKSSSLAVPETLGSAEGESLPESSEGTQKKKKRKTKRNALAKAAIAEEEEGSTAAELLFKAATRREVADADGRVSIVETVEDNMCWVLTGVWCFSSMFFNGFSDAGSLPAASLDPVPRLLLNPALHMHDEPPNTLQLTLSDFFTTDDSGAPQPFSVYIGPLGPLRATTWRSVAPREKYFDPRSQYDAIPWSGTDKGPAPEGRVVKSNFPSSVPHVIVSVELPDVDAIVAAMRLPLTNAEDSWLGVMSPAGELTIQEALRNAGTAADGAALEPETQPKLDENFGMEQLDDSLMGAESALHTDSAPAEPNLESLAETETAAPTTADTFTPQTVRMSRPDAGGVNDLAPLPLLLVRPDGVGHGIGWSVAAWQRQDKSVPTSGQTDQGPDDDGATWGLRIVQTSARGQSLTWWTN